MTKKFTIDLIDENPNNDKYYWARLTISNWLDAYAKIVEKHTISNYETSFKKEQKNSDLIELAHKGAKENEENFCHDAVSQLLFSLNHVLGLKHLSKNPNIHLLRISSISWYYAIYHSARLMITLKDKTIPYGTHAKTIKTWQDIFVNKAIILPEPYNINVTSLIESEYKEQIKILKNGITLELTKQASNNDEYLSHWASKLNADAKWHREDEENRIKKDYKIDKFSTKDSRTIRDNKLKEKQVGFLNVIFGHRGTLNYRESMYTIYDVNNYEQFNRDISNYYITAYKFFEMACFYFKKKAGNQLWQEIREDLYKKCTIDDETLIIK